MSKNEVCLRIVETLIHIQAAILKLKYLMTEFCIICGEKDTGLSECRDASSWKTLLNAATIKQHKRILDVPLGCQQQAFEYTTSLAVLSASCVQNSSKILIKPFQSTVCLIYFLP